MPFITLTTDYGTQDWFVGAMKGVMLTINPQAAVVDITHGIPPGDLRAGAFALLTACRGFPKGTIHVAVVDPGVGSERRALAVQTASYVFIGPDNGVLSWALRYEQVLQIRELTNPGFFHTPVSQTFHGRDVFAPVAAHLSATTSLDTLGATVSDFVRLPWPQHGEVIYIDRFGNAITNLMKARSTVSVGGKTIPLCKYYGAVPPGAPVAVVGSTGFIEIAVHRGSAAETLHVKIGDPVFVG